jgi:hypothetical protein
MATNKHGNEQARQRTSTATNKHGNEHVNIRTDQNGHR